ncbi:MAG: hypothetical protein WCT16_01370 [Candidatus Buchananbacteria bacterium]
MALKVLDPKSALRAMELSRGSYRPKEIIELKEAIDGETRASELAASVSGVVDLERVKKIVAMKIQLDGLYIDWIEGRIS